MPPTDDFEGVDTGQHVRVQLQEVKAELTRAIQVDVADHADMKNTMNEHRRQGRQDTDALTKKVDHVDNKVTRLDDKVIAVQQTLRAQNQTLEVMHESIKMRNADAQLQRQHVVEVTTHEKKVSIDDAADVRKRRRDIAYSVAKVIAIALATWLITYFGHLH